MEISTNLLACPVCKSSLKEVSIDLFCANAECYYGTHAFIKIGLKPVLVDFENSVIRKDNLLNSDASSLVKRSIEFSGIKNFFKRILNGSNKVTEENFRACDKLLNKIDLPKILIVGGGTIGASSQEFLKKYDSSVISFDVYNSPNVQFIADGHSIPIKDEIVDLIIVQAVLEHVINPTKVVEECYRILNSGGVIYSETPFLQHVHEGAYDFTRFTVLGHRVLFKNFSKISSGYVGGIGQSFLWAIEYFTGSLFRNRTVGKLFKIGFFWIRWIEKIIPDSYNIDGACGCYFLGKKDATLQQMKPIDFLNEYQGAQK